MLNGLQKILVCANKTTVAIKRDGFTAFIGMTDPHTSKLEPATNPVEYFSSCELVLRFFDVDVIKKDAPDLRPLALLPEQAMALWLFLDEQSSEICKLVVSCDVGVSRSKSVAIAVCDCLGLSREIIWHSHTQETITAPYRNEHVYELVKRTYEYRERKTCAH